MTSELATLPDHAEVAARLAEITNTTLEWVAYAQDRLAAGDTAEADGALTVIQNNLIAIEAQKALLEQAVGGLATMAEALIRQRDQALNERDQAQEERAYAEESLAEAERDAEQRGIEIGMEMAEDAMYDNLDQEEIHSEVEMQRDLEIEMLINDLGAYGMLEEQAELAQAFLEAKQTRERLEDLTDQADRATESRLREEYARYRAEYEEAIARGDYDENDDEGDEPF